MHGTIPRYCSHANHRRSCRHAYAVAGASPSRTCVARWIVACASSHMQSVMQAEDAFHSPCMWFLPACGSILSHYHRKYKNANPQCPFLHNDYM